MADAFRQLLKEFPKSCGGGAGALLHRQSCVRNQGLQVAIAELNAARTLNKEQYFNLATLRIISSYFYLKDRAALTNEVDAFMAANAQAKVPAEILEWLGIEYYNEKNYAAAEKYLTR